MKVTSNNLTNICRLLFLISRNADNDIYFMENDIIGIGSCFFLFELTQIIRKSLFFI